MQVSACEGEMSSVISGLENVCGRVVYIPGNVLLILLYLILYYFIF